MKSYILAGLAMVTLPLMQALPAAAAVNVSSESTITGNQVTTKDIDQRVRATGGATTAGAGGIVSQQVGTVQSRSTIRNNTVSTGTIRQDVTTGRGGATVAAAGGVVVQQVGAYGARATVERNRVQTGNISQTVTNTGGAVQAAAGGVVIQQ